MCGNLMVKFREILVEGKPLEKATPVREKTNTVKEDIAEAPSVDKIIQTPSKGNENSKSGCLGIMVIGIILSSIIAFI